MNILSSRKILIDNPVQEDEFSGGGHLRTAVALANTIRQFDGANRAIGLEGAWGAGKSSIVELARKELEGVKSEKNYSVFTFDLWTHQTSNFKRSMLESLLTWIENKEDASINVKDKIDEIRGQIRGTVVDTKVRSKKIFDFYGILFILFAFCLPFIYAWLSPFVILPKISQLNQDVYLIQGGLNIWSKISIFLLIFMFLFTVARLWHFYKRSEVKDPRGRLKDAASSTVAVFSKDAEISYEQKTIKEINPSQEEFYETFQRILSLYQNKERRLVIVVDNIDRLPNEKLSDAWSDIRSMVVGQVINPKNEEFITIIVPYDRHHVLTALNKAGEEEGDVIRKSFDAVYQVSAPVVSDASKFFQAKFKEALPTLDTSDIGYRVYKIFEYSIRGQGKPPTPRQMLAFINSVSSLWVQWHGEIDLIEVAVFSVHSASLYEKPESLRKPETIEQRYRDLAKSSNLDRNLAALAYNVSPELALQILLHNEIANAFMTDGDGEVRAISLAPGFAEILPEVFADHASAWSSEGASYLGFAAKNLVNVDVPEGVKLACRGELFKSISSLQTQGKLKLNDTKDFKFLIDLCDEDQVISLVSRINDWLRINIEQEEIHAFNYGVLWIQVIGAIISRVDELFNSNNLSNAVRHNMKVINDTDFILGAAYFADQTKLHIKDFNFRKLPSTLDKLSQSMLEDADKFYDTWPEIRHLMEEDAPSLISTLSNLLSELAYTEENSDSYSQHIVNLCKLLDSLENLESAPKELHELLVDGALYQSMKSIYEKENRNYNEFLANSIWLVIRKFMDGSLPLSYLSQHKFGNLMEYGTWVQEVITSGEIRQEIIDEIARLVLFNTQINDIISNHIDFPETTGLYAKILRSIAQDGKVNSLNFNVFVDNYEFLKKLLGAEVDSFLKVVGEQASDNEVDSVTIEELSVKLVGDLSQRTEAAWKKLLKGIDDWLISRNSEAWDLALENGNILCNLLEERLKSSNVRLMPESIKEPIINHALSLMLGQDALGRKCDFVFGVLSKHIQKGVGKDFLERLEGKNVSVHGFETLWFSYEPLVNSMKFEDRPNTSIRKLLIPAIQSNLEETVRFFDANQKSLRKAIVAADEDVRGEFLEYIVSRRTRGFEDVLLDEIIKYLEIEQSIDSLIENKVVMEDGPDPVS